MTMVDEILGMKRALDAARPKNWVDVILGTDLVSGIDGLRVPYQGRMYLIVNAVVALRLQREAALFRDAAQQGRWQAGFGVEHDGVAGARG